MTDYRNAEATLLSSILAGKKEVANRATLGPMVPIQLFQALRLIGMGSSIEEMVGDGAHALVYQSGKRLGHTLGSAVVARANKDLGKYLELIRGVCLQLSIGQLVLERADNTTGLIALRVDECVSCAGISGVKAPICNFETGLVAGVVKVFAGKEVKALEVKCNAVGDRTCAVDAHILG